MFVHKIFEVRFKLLDLFPIVLMEPIPEATLGAFESALSLTPIIATRATVWADVKVRLDISQATYREALTATRSLEVTGARAFHFLPAEGLGLLFKKFVSQLLYGFKFVLDIC